MGEHKHTITHRGITRTVAQWARITGIGYAVLKSRKEAGWDDARILSTPVLKKGANRPRIAEGLEVATEGEAMSGTTEEQRAVLAEMKRTADNSRWFYEPGAA